GAGFSPRWGEPGKVGGRKNGRRRMPGVLPPPAPADPEAVVDADVFDAVAADRARDQGTATTRTRHPWAPGDQGMAPGRARAGPGRGDQRLRGRRWERLGDPSHHRTLRHPA